MYLSQGTVITIKYMYDQSTNKDSDQPVHLHSLMRVSTVRSRIVKDPKLLLVDSKDSDQTVQMRRLIWVFAEHTSL